MSGPKRPRVPYSSCKLTESNCRMAWQISFTWRSASLRTRRFGLRIKYWSKLKTVISKSSASWRRNAAVYAAMPQSLLPVETIASVSLRDGALATGEARSARNVAAERNSNVVMCVLPGLDCKCISLRQVLAHRLHGQAANPPERERDQHDGTERSPPPRVERLLGQAWRHETGDENALSLGIGARLLDAAQCELIRRFGEAPLALDLLVLPETARHPIRARLLGIGHFGGQQSLLQFDRPNARRQHLNRGGIVAHIALQDREVGIRSGQIVAQPGRQHAVRCRGSGWIDQPLAIAERADPGESGLEPVFGLRQFCVRVRQRVIP